MSICQQVVTALPKTATNFHYESNMRHLANVFQGLLMATPDIFSTPAKFCTLWAHESERVYGDRLVSSADLQVYHDLANEVGRKFFKDIHIKTLFPNPLIFCHFANSTDDDHYNQVPSFEVLRATLER